MGRGEIRQDFAGARGEKKLTPCTAFVYTDKFVKYHLSDTHPLQQERLRMTHRLLEAYGAWGI